jgi:hypothetical protein
VRLPQQFVVDRISGKRNEATVMKRKLYGWFLAILTALVVTPAVADKPFYFQDAIDFDSINPCTGELHYLIIFFDGYYHSHRNNEVLQLVRTGFTSDGFELFAGSETMNYNTRTEIFKDSVVDMWRSEDGQMFQGRANFVIDETTLEVKVDNFRLKCLGGETLLP